MTDVKVIRVADASIEELRKERSQMEEGGLDRFKNSALREIETFARVRNVSLFLKNFLGSIMMHVLHIKSTSQGGNSFMTKQQDDLAYVKFIEDICRFSFAAP